MLEPRVLLTAEEARKVVRRDKEEETTPKARMAMLNGHTYTLAGGMTWQLARKMKIKGIRTTWACPAMV